MAICGKCVDADSDNVTLLVGAALCEEKHPWFWIFKLSPHPSEEKAQHLWLLLGMAKNLTQISGRPSISLTNPLLNTKA